jgi:site-specific DNA-methyltransferase (adenine-specific)
MPDNYTIICDDVISALQQYDDGVFRGCFCDPPYGLTDITKDDIVDVLTHWLLGDAYNGTGGGFMGRSWDSFVPGPNYWSEVYRVLKPGGNLLAFGGARTYDLLTLALRLAGFEIRDTVYWVHGQGMALGLNIGKAVDSHLGAEREVVGKGHSGASYNLAGGNDRPWHEDRKNDNGRIEYDITTPATEQAKIWDGYNTRLKPAVEPIVWAMKPRDGTFAENALKHGVAGINVDGCRVPTDGRPKREVAQANKDVDYSGTSLAGRLDGSLQTNKAVGQTDQGRFPANLIHDGSDEVTQFFPRTPGQQGRVGPEMGKKDSVNVYGDYGERPEFTPRGDQGSAARYFYCAKASGSEKNAGCEDLYWRKDKSSSTGFVRITRREWQDLPNNRRARGNIHPTVKPLALTEYLAKLIKPPQGGRLLVPFSGSGSEGKGGIAAGWDRVTLIDVEQAYCDIADARLGMAIQMKLNFL